MPHFDQRYLKGKNVPTRLTWSICASSEDAPNVLRAVSSGASTSRFIGLAVHVNQKGVMEFLATSVDDKIYVFKANTSRPKVLEAVLDGGMGSIVGFGIARLAIHIRNSLGCDVRGYNLPPEGASSPGLAVYKILDACVDSFEIDRLWGFNPDGHGEKMEFLCLRAWLSQRLASHSRWSGSITKKETAETGRLSSMEIALLYNMFKEVDMMDAAKPRTVQSDFDRIQHTKDGHVVVHNGRYKTRVRRSETTRVVLVDGHGKEHTGKAKGVNGKQTFVAHKTIKSNMGIKQVKVVGREESTNAERARDEYLLHLLQGVSMFSDPLYPFLAYVWSPGQKKMNLKHIRNARTRLGRDKRPLNQSQANVVEAMINPHRQIVITHGPPGTGKTTTISAAMREIYALGKTAWVVAQSNVGVKNIAESLSKHSVDFKLLVSKEFYFEWHEHIFSEVEKHLIRTDELPSDPREVSLLFQETRTVLCTVSTISNPALSNIGLFRLVPFRMLVVDEASQIGILDYLHLFGRFKDLQKVCFFGDPKQLPPYGRDSAPTLQSIFDVSHLKTSAYFLDTQYRMPVELGRFISDNVYQSKLNSAHRVSGWNCLKFVDVWNGAEEKSGKSWKNAREVQTIVHLVRKYYRDTEYCVITPYDAQRNAIQNSLKRENLPWENVFNVDSFQGNEAEYILVSVVRTTGPGFLKSLNRVNVMLTRCKSGMVIVTKREFTRHESVRKTLLGKLALHWEGKVGRPRAWCKWTDVAEKKVSLPCASTA